MPIQTEKSFLPAARKILLKEGRPMKCTEIVHLATQAGLLETAGQTPRNTLNALINRKIKHYGDASGFRKVGPGLFEAID